MADARNAYIDAALTALKLRVACGLPTGGFNIPFRVACGLPG
ncbi:UNVERIFIED_ORG: hypothetical protein J2X79_000233 [Arthrobacter globiformis]|nr:hypothetical protein [Arthrobacter globiformis]